MCLVHLTSKVRGDARQRGVPLDCGVRPCAYLYHSGFLVFLQKSRAADLSSGSTFGSSSFSLASMSSWSLYLRLSFASFASVPGHDWQIDQLISACLSSS